MRRYGPAMAMLVLGGIGALVGCGRHGSADEQLSHLRCGKTTYRLSASQIDAELRSACDRVSQSAAALDTYGPAARVRFTCARADGHVVQSVLVSKDLLSDYDQACAQYVTAAAAALSRSDTHAAAEALRALTEQTNVLTRSFVEEANRSFARRKADRDVLERLVKERGGSIEIS
jgi:hypothetical protein